MPARLALVLGLGLALTAPAAAQAATFTVDPADANQACSASDRSCPTIGQAIQAAAAADTIKILKGTYAEAVAVPSGKDGLKLEGAGIGDVKITGSGTADVVSLASRNVTLSGLTVDVPANGESAVAVSATGAKLNALVLQRNAASDQDVAVVEVGSAGSAAAAGIFVVQGAGAAGTPAISSEGAEGLQLADAVVLSSVGSAVVLTASDKNTIVRSTLASTSTGASADALRISSENGGARSLTVDSTYLIGGVKGAGLRATSSGSSAGDIALKARHVTVPAMPGADARGIVIDAGASGTPGFILTPGTPAGSITATVNGSIVHNPSSVTHYEPALLLDGAENSASLTFTNSDVPATPAAGSDPITRGDGNTFNDDAKLFAPKSLKLRADAPVIDKGGPLQSGESATDPDGNPRLVGAATDMGADEYVNQPPKALFGITNKNPRQGEAIGFVSGSTDPEQGAGGGITEYRWDFGDGTKQTTSVGGVAHTYTELGTYKATLQVVDAQGLVSQVSPAQEVVVTDGVVPRVAITAPAHNARLNLKSTYLQGAKRPKSKQLTLLGTAADASGVESVEVALALTKRDKVKKAKKKKKKKRTASRSQRKALCEFYSGRLFTKKKDCTKETWVKATLVQGGWVLKTRRGMRLPAGRYQVKVRAKDKTGLLSSAFTTKNKTVVNFRVR